MGAQADGRSFVYIVDRSGSMSSGNRLAQAKADLMESIEGLAREQQFFVYFYDSTTDPLPGPPGFRWATRVNKNACAAWVASISPRGLTNPEHALLAAIHMRPDVIFLMSDGDFNEQVCGKIKAAQGDSPVAIHTICFVNPSGERVMQRIASENNGKYTFNPGRP